MKITRKGTDGRYVIKNSLGTFFSLTTQEILDLQELRTKFELKRAKAKLKLIQKGTTEKFG